MLSDITINVDFLAGTDIKDAIEEAKQKAIEWNVAYVRFTINGVNFSIGRNADVNGTMEKYRDPELQRYGIVS